MQRGESQHMLHPMPVQSCTLYCGPAEHLSLHDGDFLCHSTGIGGLFCTNARSCLHSYI